MPLSSFGIEVRRFLRQHVASQRDIRHLLHAHRIQQKRQLRFAAIHGRERRFHFALVADIFFRRHRFRA